MVGSAAELARRLVRCVAILATLALGPGAAAAPLAAVVDRGFYCALEPVSTRPAEDTIAGVVSFLGSTPAFQWRSTVVPAAIGIGFGVHVQVSPELAGPVRVITEHPPMGPSGTTRESWETTLRSEDVNYLGFSFETDYERVPGPWSFAAYSNGREIFRADFEVVPAARFPGVSCDPSVPLS